MRLVAFGCSNTYGFALPQDYTAGKLPAPSKHAWPTVLANKLGVECVNKGLPGQSNKLISHVMSNTHLYPTDIVVILWTYMDRWSVIEDPKYNEHNPMFHFSIASFEKNKRSRMYYKHIYNKTDHMIDTHYRIDYANLYLNNKGIKHYQTSCTSIEHPALIDIKFRELQHIDHADDDLHPGIKAHKAIADTLYKRIVQ